MSQFLNSIFTKGIFDCTLRWCSGLMGGGIENMMISMECVCYEGVEIIYIFTVKNILKQQDVLRMKVGKYKHLTKF